MIDAVIFDCDGVLVDSEVLAIRGEREALGALGLDYDPPTYVERFVGMHDRTFFAALRIDYRAVHGQDAPSDFEETVLAGRRKHKDGLEAVAGAHDALRAARERIGAVAVASSSRAEFLRSKLERTGLFELVAPHVYSADLVANGKPAPDIFLYAAERLGVAPARCVVLEDSVNGVRAARAAGMRAWGFLGGGHIFQGHEERLIAAGAEATLRDFRAAGRAISALEKSIR
ncbi:MAG: HAD-IA family hydrolase [Alphaproteobacteria bacterium]|nr:HAD-IA family hydrolase [Alphaproteobacteria bacterium]